MSEFKIQQMSQNLTYTTERLTADISAKDYIARFRNVDYFVELCRKCGNYGKRYGCPPFDKEQLDIINRYQNVWIMGVKVVPNDPMLPLSAANDLMSPVTCEMNEELLEKERILGGYAFGFVGKCPYCGGATCQRIKGKPCMHPDKVRPSLEAFGFDMSKTAKELLGLEIKWSDGVHIPEYLTLVCGIFH